MTKLVRENESASRKIVARFKGNYLGVNLSRLWRIRVVKGINGTSSKSRDSLVQFPSCITGIMKIREMYSNRVIGKRVKFCRKLGHGQRHVGFELSSHARIYNLPKPPLTRVTASFHLHFIPRVNTFLHILTGSAGY